MEADLERFYDLLGKLEMSADQGRELSEYTGRFPWPKRGVYFFCDPGECRAGLPGSSRVVRVGTHAVSRASKSTLWGRLRAHRGTRTGGGNHRGSIFRLHVGEALLRKDKAPGSEINTWGLGASARKAIRDDEARHENRVSVYLGRMTVLWVEVPDDPGPRSKRAYIESNAIALLSNFLMPIDPPSQSWLGMHSPRHEIRCSGLWNVKHVMQSYDPRFLDDLEAYVSGQL